MRERESMREVRLGAPLWPRFPIPVGHVVRERWRCFLAWLGLARLALPCVACFAAHLEASSKNSRKNSRTIGKCE